jgi:murein DD-endopeptidase MepM/ murein hydrolase activator NlpD
MVASVVDPSATDDGLGLTGPGAPNSQFGHVDSEHPVRARLLARAQGVAQTTTSSPSPTPWTTPEFIDPTSPSDPSPDPSPEPADLPEADWAQEIISTPSHSKRALPPLSPAPGTPPPFAVANELERIGRKPSGGGNGPGISPNMIALLGGLLGLTVISTLGVILSKTEGGLVPGPVKTEQTVPVKEKEPAQKPEVKKTARQKVPGPWRISDDAAKPGHRVLSGKIGKAAFLRAIQDAGLPKGEAYRVYTALKGLKDLDHCKSTDTFEALVTGNEKTLVAFEYGVNKEEVYQAKANQEGRLEGSKLDLQVIRNQIRRSFTHDGKSFEQSARLAGFDPGLAENAESALRGHSSLNDFKRDDRIRVIAQEVTVLGEFSRYAGIEALEIIRDGEETRRIYFYPHPVEGGHFDKSGKAPYEGGWRKPIPGAPITSKFNMKRMHPVLNKVMPHTGTDFGAPTGTPIGATSPGVVSFRGPAGASGNLVKIKHEGGYESGYAHLSRFANLDVGDKVDRLQTVGYCGSTGRSTGPHLHFTMKKNDVFIDAESLNLDGMRVLAKSHREAFLEVTQKYDPILDQIPLPERLGPDAVASQETVAAAASMMNDPMMGDAEENDETDDSVDGSGEHAPSAEVGTAKIQAPSPSDPTPAKPAQPVAPSAIFLSDAELLRMQSGTDDGEVNE